MNSTGLDPMIQEEEGNSIGKEKLLDEGLTSFMFIATALVQFMTPGVAMFYAGMNGNLSTVAIMLQCLAALGLVFILWLAFVFSLTFGAPWITIAGYHFLGDPSTYFMWWRVGIYGPLQRASKVVVCCLPGMLFASYHGMFAVITPALISGGIVDRMRFGPYLTLIGIWLITVYAPLGYWNWGGGWMFQCGAWDFAGGLVVHESAGFGSLGILMVLGKRDLTGFGGKAPVGHSMPLMFIGTAILWFGWFGFNGGSALTIGGLTTIAFVNTQVAPSAGMMTWLMLDWIYMGKPNLTGGCAGVVTGLVVITPCAGFVQPYMALVAGVVGAMWCWTLTILLKKTSLDDPSDTVSVHGCGGFLGTILVGVISDDARCLDPKAAPTWCANPGTVARSWEQTKIQFGCAVAAALYSFVISYLITKFLYCFCFQILQTYEEQDTTRDDIAHGELAYVDTPVTIGKTCDEDTESDTLLTPDSEALTSASNDMNVVTPRDGDPRGLVISPLGPLTTGSSKSARLSPFRRWGCYL